MNILMTLSNPFTHDPRVYNEARSLIKNGHNVTVLAWDRNNEASPFEEKDEISVVRSYNTKLMNLLPFDIIKLHFWWNKGYKDVLKLQREKHFDIVHCHDLDSLPIGIKLKKKFGLPVIYDAHEIWGHIIARDLSKSCGNYFLRKEKKLIKYVDHVITVSERIKDYFKRTSNKPISVIMNCKPLQSKIYQPPNNEKFTLLYLGSLGKNRFITELIDVVKELPEVHCIIGGMGKPEYINAIKKKCSNIKNVDFLGRIPMKEVIPMTKKSDITICMSSPQDMNSNRGLANKQFEAMVCGRPIICTKDTYSGEITEKEKCGLVALYTTKDLKKTILKLKDDPKLCEELGTNALNAAIKKYNWEFQERRLVEIYEKIR